MSGLIVDPYGGPGGWAEGLRALGLDEIGIELDPSACATRAAAGHRTIRADVTQFPIDRLIGRVQGMTISPPCQAFSTAGKGEGRQLLDALRQDICDHAWDAGPSYPPGVRHVLEVGRWALHVRPRWIAAEQVPPVLPLWEAYADRLRDLGYSTWAGILCAADYGVPQTRRRAILMASLDRSVAPPAPTHADGGATTLFGDLAPWVSMATALGWTGRDTPARTLCGDRSPRWVYDRPDDVVLRAGAQANATVRGLDEPAPTVTASWDNNDTQWVIDRRTNSKGAGGTMVPTVPVPADRPAPTLTAKGAEGQWVWRRPATTDGENSVRLTIQEALTLQGFRPDYPVQGTKTAQFQQVGNAVPPPLAAAIVGELVGIDARVAA